MSELVVTDLTKEFPSRGEPLVVLRGISLKLASGQNMAIIGPSGSGKSTLLHIIGTLDQPTTGTVRLNEQDPFKLSEPKLAKFRNEQIGFVFQDHHLLPQLTVWENVLIPTVAAGGTTAAHRDRATELIKRVGLEARSDHRPAELSGGERQRAAIARALILSPNLILADEPTGNLDRTTAASIAGLLAEIQREESVMLMVVTHSADLAAKMGQQWEIDDGKLRQV